MSERVKPSPLVLNDGMSHRQVVEVLEALIFTSARDWRRAVVIDRNVRDLIVECMRRSIGAAKLERRPVAWRIKDFADGWIITQDEQAAYLAVEQTGAKMQGLYVRDGT